MQELFRHVRQVKKQTNRKWSVVMLGRSAHLTCTQIWFVVGAWHTGPTETSALWHNALRFHSTTPAFGVTLNLESRDRHVLQLYTKLCCHMDPCQSFLSPKNRRTSSTKIIIYRVEGVIWQAPDPILSNQFDEHQQIAEVQCIAGAIMTTHILRAAAVPVLLRSSTNWAPAIATITWQSA